MSKDLLDRTGDDIIDGVDEGPARVVVADTGFTGDPLTGDELIAVLERLPPEIRKRPVLVQAEEPRVIVALRAGVLLTEITPF